MGDLTGNGDSDEKPVRTVELSGHYMGATEVTQEQWQKVMGNNPSHFPKFRNRAQQRKRRLSDQKKLPVESVQWQEAMEFSRRLTGMEQEAGRLPEGSVYTLPTEAQWEHACRAGTEGDWTCEKKDLLRMAWYGENSGYQTHPVATRKPNTWGFYDMHGNVWEWCRDWYQDSYKGLGTKDPSGPKTGTYHVLRGGSWGGHAEMNLRASYRVVRHPLYRYNLYGFRVVIEVSGGGDAGSPSAKTPERKPLQ